MNGSTDDLFADRPATVFIEGVGEVPVVYESPPEPEVLPPVDPAAAYRVSDGVQWVHLNEEIVLWNPDTSVSHVLDPMAALLWQCIDGRSTLTEIMTDVAEAFGRAVDEVRDDFEPAVAVWLRDGFLADADAADHSAPPDAGVSGGDGVGWRFLVDPPND
jgi:hypothetical protein